MRHSLLFIIFLFCLSATIGGCKSQSPVVVAPQVHNRDSVRIEYIYKIDSIYNDRWHVIQQKGDTVYRTDSIVLYTYRNIEMHDTITMNRTDTIALPPQYIEKPISGGSKFLIWSGAIMWGIIALIVIAMFIAIAMRIRRV